LKARAGIDAASESEREEKAEETAGDRVGFHDE
jgi:hypothetical protein